jgi:HEAT repeat protein
MEHTRERRGGEDEVNTLTTYRGMRALVALMIALLVLLCLVIVQYTSLTAALHALRRAPSALDAGAILTLSSTVLLPMLAGALTYSGMAPAIHLTRLALYSIRLHQAIARDLGRMPLVMLGLTMRATRFATESATGEDIVLAQALAAPDSLLLLGESGSGKTTALYRIARSASQPQHLLTTWRRGQMLPVLLSLAQLTAHTGTFSALDALVRHAMAPYATRGLLAALPDLLRSGKCLLLCDELEALPAPQRATFCEALAVYTAGGGRVVACCRLDAYSAYPEALRALDALPRLVLEGVSTTTIAAAMRRTGTFSATRSRDTDLLETLHAHQLGLWAALPAHLAELYTLTLDTNAGVLPFGRAQATARYLETLAARAPSGSSLLRLLGALAASLLLARLPALPIPADLPLGATVTRWFTTHPPLAPVAPPAAEGLEAALNDALTMGLLRLSADGRALVFAHGTLQIQCAAYALAADDDGFGWLAPELLAPTWVLPVLLWSGLREEPVDVTRRLLHLADTPDTTAIRAGLRLRADVEPAIFALALAAMADSLAPRLAEANGTESDRIVTLQTEQQLRDLLDRIQVMLADAANIPRLANALRIVERQAGPELAEALAFLVTYPPLSRLLRAEIATILGLLATPRALEVLVALLAETEPLMHQAVTQAVEWAGLPAVSALGRAESSPDERIRSRATELLSRVGPGAEERALAELQAGNPTRRLAATRALATVSSPQAEDALIARLADPDPDVRHAAATALGQLGTPGASSALMGLLADPDPQLRVTVTEGLGTLARGGNNAALIGLLRLLDDDAPQVRAAAIAALGALDDTRARDAIAARRDDPDPWVRHAVFQTLHDPNRS